jgi:hypothetical protein
MGNGVTDERLAEWGRLADAATDGPWESAVGGIYYDPRKPGLTDRADIKTAWTWQPTYKSGDKKGQPKGEPEHVAVAFGVLFPAILLPDAAFIAAARTAVPELVAEVRRLRAELAAAKGEVCRG